jgi:hypothetical protein
VPKILPTGCAIVSDFLPSGKHLELRSAFRVEFSAFDPRGIGRHSTRIKFAIDRVGCRAARVALTRNEEPKMFWKNLAKSRSAAEIGPYEVRWHARALGYDYIPNGELITLPQKKRLERLEVLAHEANRKYRQSAASLSANYARTRGNRLKSKQSKDHLGQGN